MTTPIRFTWYELMTKDAGAAGAFYRQVVGWTTAPSAPGSPYTVFSADGVAVGGMAELTDSDRASGIKPQWIGYMPVDNVDDSVAQLVKAGGALHGAIEDVPGVLRRALVNDPQGALFALFTPVPGSARPMPQAASVGSVGWHELMAVEGPTAFDFYLSLFGWTRSGVFDMGPMGDYQLFGAGGEGDFGGIMTKPAVIPSPYWTFYFNVDGAKAGAARVRDAGGIVINGPHQVPSGDWVVQARDPQEAIFALVSKTP